MVNIQYESLAKTDNNLIIHTNRNVRDKKERSGPGRARSLCGVVWQHTAGTVVEWVERALPIQHYSDLLCTGRWGLQIHLMQIDAVIIDQSDRSIEAHLIDCDLIRLIHTWTIDWLDNGCIAIYSHFLIDVFNWLITRRCRLILLTVIGIL